MRAGICLLPLLGLCIFTSHAQTNIHNSGILKINTSADILYVTGNFTNTSSASLTNNGQLYILRDVDNSEVSMNAGTGTLYLNGSGTQTIAGAELFKTYHLVSNNNSGIILNNDLSISGSHSFTSGVITTSATPNFLVYEAGASYSGAADTRHVNGWVKKLGNTDFIFPVGNGTYLRQAALTNLSSGAEFNVKYNAPTPNNFLLQYPLLSVDVYEYWQMKKIAGGTANVTLTWDNTKVPFPGYIMGDMAVAYFDGSYWTDQGGTASGDVSTTGSIIASNISWFGDFVIGSRSFPLPLKFLSVTAQRNQDHVDLTWITAEEVNTDHFEIERSRNGIQFVTIGKKPAANRYQVQQYAYEDFSHPGGMAFYRLRCIDKDGKSKYSKIVSLVENAFLKNNIQVLNPVRDEIIIRSKMDDKDPTAYILYDQAGRAILKGSLLIKGGMDNTIRLSFKQTKGTYFLHLFRANAFCIEKLVIN